MRSCYKEKQPFEHFAASGTMGAHQTLASSGTRLIYCNQKHLKGVVVKISCLDEASYCRIGG